MYDDIDFHKYTGTFQHPRSPRRKYHVCCTGCTNAAMPTPDRREEVPLGEMARSGRCLAAPAAVSDKAALPHGKIPTGWDF